MRPSLPHQLAERRQSRRHGRGARLRRAGTAYRTADAGTPDAAVARVREAGGPLDRASYGCHCGYLFVAEVSTTVRCPHCGAGQAW
jgi:hypothetical protein